MHGPGHVALQPAIAITAGVTCVLTVIAGFAPAVLDGPESLDGPPARALLQVHVMLFAAWLVLFAVQAQLAQRLDRNAHRMLGCGAIAVAAGMTATAVLLVYASWQRELGVAGAAPNWPLTIIPASQTVLFAGLVTAGAVLRRRPDWHARLMLTATLVVATPALARMSTHLVGYPHVVLILVLANGVLLLIIGWDWRRCGVLHPAWIVAGGAVVCVRLARVPLAHSDWWQSGVRWLVA